MQAEALAVLYMGLLLFGCGFNRLVGTADRKGWLEGFTWFAVIIGVGVTVLAVTLATWGKCFTGWQFGLMTLGAFTASGAPMAVGAVARYVGSREEDKRSMRAEALQSWWINE